MAKMLPYLFSSSKRVLFMNQNRMFIYGLIVGFLICFFVVKNNPVENKISQDDSSSENIVATQPVRKPAAVATAPASLEMHARLKATAPAVTQPAQPTAEDRQAEHLENTLLEAFGQKKKMTIHFSENDVTSMENQWSDLQRQIQVSKEARGWRIKMLAPNTVFASSGLNQGNLITYDSIRNIGDDRNSNLPTRIATILNHVSVQ